MLALGALPFLNLAAKRFSTRIHPSVLALQQELAELSSVVEETVSGIRVVKGFGAERLQARPARVEADDVYDQSLGRGAHPRRTSCRSSTSCPPSAS